MDFGGESMKRVKESTSHVMLGDLSVLVQEEFQTETCEQVCMNTMKPTAALLSKLSILEEQSIKHNRSNK